MKWLRYVPSGQSARAAAAQPAAGAIACIAAQDYMRSGVLYGALGLGDKSGRGSNSPLFATARLVLCPRHDGLQSACQTMRDRPVLAGYLGSRRYCERPARVTTQSKPWGTWRTRYGHSAARGALEANTRRGPSAGNNEGIPAR
jgi:hypothetical protein